MLHHTKSDEPTAYSLAILGGLQHKTIWSGGHKKPVAKTRAANKLARRSRRINRGR